MLIYVTNISIITRLIISILRWVHNYTLLTGCITPNLFTYLNLIEFVVWAGGGTFTSGREELIIQRFIWEYRPQGVI